MDDDELMLCKAPSEAKEKPPLRHPSGIRHGLKMADAGRHSPRPPSAMSHSTREPSEGRPDSRGSNTSDYSGFRQGRGRMLMERHARGATPTLEENGPYKRSFQLPSGHPQAVPLGDDEVAFQPQDHEVSAITAAAARRKEAWESFKSQVNSQETYGFTPRAGRGIARPGSAMVNRPTPQGPQVLRSEGKNWRGIHRPPSAHESSRLVFGAGPLRAARLGCEAGHSTQYSCRAEAWWKRSPGADRRCQGLFERSILQSQEPGWNSELGYLNCGCPAGELCPHWPSGRPVKAGDAPPLPGAEGGQARSLGLNLAPPPKARA
ncbi:unnamed protein product [Durusdinium trenchii]|uniref:Uncharacterized protein n=1 Tax=Durusdinium trenchii TaxID=1381693 RepID=A0ABP0NZX3_9DINO